jgi:hypothetical protein
MITNIIDLAEYGAACDEKIYIIAEPCNNTDGGSYYPSGIVIYSNQSNGGEFIVPEDYKYNVEYLIGTYSCQRCGITVKMYETIDIDHNAIFTIKYTLGEGEEITILNGVNCGHHYTPSTSA